MDNAELALNSDSQELSAERAAGPVSIRNADLTRLELEAAPEEGDGGFEEHVLGKREGATAARLEESEAASLRERIARAIRAIGQRDDCQFRFLLVREYQGFAAHILRPSDDGVSISPSHLLLIQKSCRQSAFLLFSGAIIGADCFELKSNGQDCVSVNRIYMPAITPRALRFRRPFKALCTLFSGSSQQALQQLLQAEQPSLLVLFVRENAQTALRAARSLQRQFGFELVFLPCHDAVDATPEFPNVFSAPDGAVHQNPAQFRFGGADFLAIDYPLARFRYSLLQRDAQEQRPQNPQSPGKILIKSAAQPQQQEAPPEEEDQLQDALDRSETAPAIVQNEQLQAEITARGLDERKLAAFALALRFWGCVPFMPAHLPVDYTRELSLRPFDVLIVRTDFALPAQRLGGVLVVCSGALDGAGGSCAVLELGESGSRCRVVGLG